MSDAFLGNKSCRIFSEMQHTQIPQQAAVKESNALFANFPNRKNSKSGERLAATDATINAAFILRLFFLIFQIPIDCSIPDSPLILSFSQSLPSQQIEGVSNESFQFCDPCAVAVSCV
jgi:hypothetical protein